jgi:SulP family sulfate permease
VRQVRTISDSDGGDVPLSDSERGLLDRANGKLLFLYLSGPMIFSVSKAISRQHTSVCDYEVMILDLTDVTLINMTVGLARENAIKDAQDAHCEVFLLCPNEQTLRQLEKFHVVDLVPSGNTYALRYQALDAALGYLGKHQPLSS